jgi:hypothetical protein
MTFLALRTKACFSITTKFTSSFRMTIELAALIDWRAKMLGDMRNDFAKRWSSGGYNSPLSNGRIERLPK